MDLGNGRLRLASGEAGAAGRTGDNDKSPSADRIGGERAAMEALRLNRPGVTSLSPTEARSEAPGSRLPL